MSRERAYMALSPFRRGTIAMHIEKYGKTRYWALVDTTGELVCLCVYRRGATEVVRRLQALALAPKQCGVCKSES